MINRVPSNYTSMEVLSLARHENPKPSPVLDELFKRCQKELSEDPPADAGGYDRHVTRAKVR